MFFNPVLKVFCTTGINSTINTFQNIDIPEFTFFMGLARRSPP